MFWEILYPTMADFWKLFDAREDKFELLGKYSEVDEDFIEALLSERDMVSAQTHWNALDDKVREDLVSALEETDEFVIYFA